jgi:hypothetical protein
LADAAKVVQVAVKRHSGHRFRGIVAFGTVGVVNQVYVDVALLPSAVTATGKHQGEENCE